MMQENLNIHYHVKRLILMSLGKYKTEDEQANALGINKRTLYKYRKIYNLPVRQKRNERKRKNNTTA